MLRDMLLRIGSEYLTARQEPNARHPLAEFIRNGAPAHLSDLFSAQRLDGKGGCGQSGQWAHVPWIGLFDPAVTTGAQYGFYVVYLFSADMHRVCLSLNQGATEVQRELGGGKATLAELRSRASIMRERAAKNRNRLSAKDIELVGETFYPRAYEAGHVFGRSYAVAALPIEQELLLDLSEAIRLYRTLLVGGGCTILSDDEAADAGLDGSDIIERRRYIAHRKIERNSKAAKAAKDIHGFVCQVCALDMSLAYGVAGAGYIEAHHLVPLADLPEDEPVALDPRKDFAVLCANCHRVIHRKGAPKTIDDLRGLPEIIRFKELLVGGLSPPVPKRLL